MNKIYTEFVQVMQYTIVNRKDKHVENQRLTALSYSMLSFGKYFYPSDFESIFSLHYYNTTIELNHAENN